jgi:hypothetical protein
MRRIATDLGSRVPLARRGEWSLRALSDLKRRARLDACRTLFGFVRATVLNRDSGTGGDAADARRPFGAVRIGLRRVHRGPGRRLEENAPAPWGRLLITRGINP